MDKIQTFENIFHTGFRQTPVRKSGWQKHYCDSPGMLLCVSGKGRIAFQDKSEEVCPGDLAVYNALPQHQFNYESEWSYYWVHIPPYLMEPYAEIPCNSSVPGVFKIRFPEKILQRLRLDFQELLTLRSKREYGWSILAEKIVQLILARAFLRIKPVGPSAAGISRISRKLDSFLPGRNMEELAKECGLSRSAFFMKFKKEYGCSPLTYRNTMILTRAKSFLSATDLKVQEISDILHFQNAYYFTNFFMKHVHVPPTEYRNKHKNVKAFESSRRGI